MFKGQSERSKHCVDLDIEWVEEIFSTREPQFYKSLFQSNIKDQDGLKYSTLTATIVNTKDKGEISYNYKAPLVEYHKNYSNSCCFCSLASEFTMSG